MYETGCFIGGCEQFFFTSCHQAVQPELRGKQVIVAGDPKKRTGIVLATSYAAKALGVKTGMALWEARALCPQGYFFKPYYRLYVDTSIRILKIMRDLTDLVKPFSLDEFFTNLTGVIHLWWPPEKNCPASEDAYSFRGGDDLQRGIGPNKLVAKMVAGAQKPDRLTVLETIYGFQTFVLAPAGAGTVRYRPPLREAPAPLQRTHHRGTGGFPS